jgi:cytochrome P450
LLQAKDVDGNPFPDTVIRDTTNSFLMAGYDSLADSLTWTAYLLAQPENRRALRCMQDEIDRLSAVREPQFDDLRAYEYVEAVFNEGMRMLPAAVMIRACTQDAVVNGYSIRKGTTVLCPAAAMHHNPLHYDAPDVFRPERFLASSTADAAKRARHAHMPFGVGPRMCIAYRFALEQGKLALIRIFKRFEFAVHASSGVVRPVMAFALVPKEPIYVTITARHPHTHSRRPSTCYVACGPAVDTAGSPTPLTL